MGVVRRHHRIESLDDLGVGVDYREGQIGVIGRNGFARLERTGGASEAFPGRACARRPVDGMTGETAAFARQGFASGCRGVVEFDRNGGVGLAVANLLTREEPEADTQNQGESRSKDCLGAPPHFLVRPAIAAGTVTRELRNLRFGQRTMDELTETWGGLTRRQFITAASGLAVASTVLGLGAKRGIGVEHQPALVLGDKPSAPGAFAVRGREILARPPFGVEERPQYG